MSSRSPFIRVTALAVGLAIVGAGCGTTKPEKSRIGVRRIALDFAFSDKSLKVDIPPNVIVRYLPALPDDIAAAIPATKPFLPANDPLAPFACPKAPADAEVSDVAPSAIVKPPQAGTYLLRNQGQLTVHTAAFPITLPYPPVSKLVIRDVKVEDVTDVYAGTVRKTKFVTDETIVERFRVVSTYQFDNGELSLIQRETVSDGNSTFFVPTPAVEVFRFTGPGGSWQSAGIDVATTNAMVVQGAIGAREALDICGTVVDSVPVRTDEQQVDLTRREQSGSQTGKPTITNYAPQYGGLPLRRERHTTQVFQSDAGPLRIDTNVVSTMMSLKPVPPELLR